MGRFPVILCSTAKLQVQWPLPTWCSSSPPGLTAAATAASCMVCDSICCRSATVWSA